jgi:NAD-dependent DNA ligase
MEKVNYLKPRKALNKAFLKVKPNRNEIANISQILSQNEELTEKERAELEAEIDRLVYKALELGSEEFNIIEFL